jgi:hypothetical protein
MQPSPLLNSLMVDQQQQLHLHQQRQQQIQHQQDQQQQLQNMMNYPMQNNRPADMNQQPQMMPTGLVPDHVQQTDINYSPHIMQQQQQLPPQQQQQQQSQSQQQQQQHLNQVTTLGKPIPVTNV